MGVRQAVVVPSAIWAMPLVLAWALGPSPAAGQPLGPGPQVGFRRLAPGVLTVIPPWAASDSHAIRGDLLEVSRGLAERAWRPREAPANATLVESAKNREFLRDIWCLEFAFKPPRIIDVDVPVVGRKMQRKRLWYLVYRVRNMGGRRTVVDPEDPTKRIIEAFEVPVRFLPHFVLESWEGLTEADRETAYRSYLDRVVPAAMDPIRRREDPAREFLDSAGMAAQDIPPGGERWGVAIWEDVDPRIDFFSICVRGLTNAIRWRPRSDARFAPDEAPGSGMEYALGCLKLDFWRPGDDRDEEEEEMNVGFVGMFERMKLGGTLLEALGRPPLVKSRPVAGLADLGLSWADLAVLPDDGDGSSAANADLLALAKVVRAVAAIPEPTARGPLVRAVFGDVAVEWIEELSRALIGPVDPDREARRRQALEDVGIEPESAARTPLEALAAVFESIAGTEDAGKRRERTEAFFGPATPRVEGLSREVALARTVATLADVPVNPRSLREGDGLAAFEALSAAIGAVAEDQRQPLLAGLFGPRGPLLYKKATEEPEGIDHTWVFRYETGD